MKTIEKSPDLKSRLRAAEPFAEIKEEALDWLIDRADYKLYDTGVLLFRPGQEVSHMQIIIEGEFLIEMEQNGERRELGTWGTGQITGVLPFSRMTEAQASGIALRPTYVLELHRKHFVEMVNISYTMTQNLVAQMSNRIRAFSQQRSQTEKLLSLGKLSAGLAHELNNPAAAIVRSAQDLHAKVHQTPDKFKAVITMRISPEQTDAINAILFDRIEKGPVNGLNSLERSDREDEVLDWLEEHEIEDGEDIAETFTDYQIGIEELEQVKTIAQGQHLPALIWWLESTLALETLVNEVKEASDRIASLVTSIKKYTHVDRSHSQDSIDVHEGLYSTIMILKHRLKKKQINLEKDLDLTLPPIQAFGNELNQVWTNLIDNAIDAMNEKGTLRIKTERIRDYLAVSITDSGNGIPPESISQIFDPFYTTKSFDKGTGMGLDIAKRIIDRHRGRIEVSSQPGATTFQILLPIS
jgi:signal transduction histidine kinase